MLTRALSLSVVLVGLGGGALTAQAQLDPTKRELIQLGYNQPLQGRAPISGYAFYYLNLPQLHRTNLAFRLALAPVFLDAELGFRGLLGPHTDLAVGAAGGGFADSHSEIRRGQFFREESFTGHGGGGSLSVYHRFNGDSRIPLNGVVRGEARTSAYSRDKHTAPGFTVPSDQTTYHVRSGLRWGGLEPLMLPEVAMELSAWYEGQFRSEANAYGFAGDRVMQRDSHLVWGRALLAYTLPESRQSFNLNLTAGVSFDSDRFSAYRLGGLLPLSSEFPLALPGYYYQEISARRFALIGANYTVPLDRRQRWAVTATLATAVVNYVAGLEQAGQWHSGVGGGVIYRSPSEAWQLVVGYAYGIDAIRGDGRGAHSIGFLVQFDLDRARVPFFEPGENPLRSRGLQRLFRGLF